MSSSRSSGSLTVLALASGRPEAPRRQRWLLVLVLCFAGAAGAGGYLYDRMSRNPVEAAAAQLNGGHALAGQLMLRGALRDNPNDAKAMWLLGKADLALGEPVAAERDLRAAGALGMGAARLRLPLAMALLSQHKPAAVLAVLDQEGADPADLPRLLVVRARAAAQLNDVPAVEAALAQARRVAPTLIEVPLAAADLAWQRHNVVQAEAGADRALQLDGRSAEALAMKAQVLEMRGQRAAALELLGKAIAAEPRAQPIRLERARMLLGIGRFDDASVDIDAVLAVKPKDLTANYLKTAVLIHDTDYAGADALLQRMVKFMPRLPRGWFTVALVKLHMRQLAPAAEAAEKYVRRAPGDLEGRKLLARIGLASQRPDMVLAALQPALQAKSTDGEVLSLIGAAQAMAGRLADAEGTFSRAAALTPANAGLQARLGLARLMAGDAPGAMEALERVARLGTGAARGGPAAGGGGGGLGQAGAGGGGTRGASAAGWRQLGRRAARCGAGAGAVRLRCRGGRFGPGGQGPSGGRFGPGAVGAGAADAGPDRGGRGGVGRRACPRAGAAGGVGQPVADLRTDGPGAAGGGAADGGTGGRTWRSGRHPGAGGVVRALRGAGQGACGLERPGRAGRRVTADDAGACRSGGGCRPARVRPADLRDAGGLGTGTGTGANGDRAAVCGVPGGAGVPEEAGQVLAAGLTARPGDPDLQRALVRLRYRAAGLDAALATAEALRRDRANMPGAATLRGDVLQAAGRFAEAAAALQAELAVAPSSALVIRTAGAVHAARGPVEAAMMLRGWMAGHPNDVAALTVLASMEDAAKNLEGARAALEQLLAREPNDPGVMNNLAWAYQQLGDGRAYPLALRAYLATFDPMIADTLGCIMLAQNRTQEALALLRYAGREVPSDLMIQLHLAQAVRQAGLREEARAMLTGLTKKQFDGHAVAVQLLAGLGPT